MGKVNHVDSSNRLCADSRELIDQTAVLIMGSGRACAVHKDQIEKSKASVARSREQISRFRTDGAPGYPEKPVPSAG